jgi:HK97 family phage portal protein
MSVFSFFRKHDKTLDDRPERDGAAGSNLSFSDNFSMFDNKYYCGEPYLLNAWVNIAINTLARNVARAGFVIERDGEAVLRGPLYELFRRPSEYTSRYDIWKETAAWWCLEGECFWWFGDNYSGGLPKEIIILDPRRMRREDEGEKPLSAIHRGAHGRWFYQSDLNLIPILHDEIIHFREWNPYNPIRGINPLIPLALELEQDYFANRANSQLLKNNAIPQGVLKTDQVIRPEEADAIERRWESKFGAVRSGRKIAVLGKGTSFEPITLTPDVCKLFDLKRWNVYTILAKYGIPPRVANIYDKTTSLSGKDTAEQHSAFWKYTLIPLLKQFEHIMETQFFVRFNLRETGRFDLSDIPELQRSEDEQSNRDIAEINAGLKTINDVLRERGKEPKSWGDIWYRPKNLVPMREGDGA